MSNAVSCSASSCSIRMAKWQGTTVPGFGYLKYSGATRRPFDTLIPEIFKVRNGKIIEIEATMPSLPFGSTHRLGLAVRGPAARQMLIIIL